MDETLIKGDVTELQCILDFQKRGYYVSIPFSSSCRYDIVADIDSKLIRVQCKTSSYQDGVLTFCTTRQTTNTQKTIRYSYTKEEIDFFYTSWNGYGFLVPVDEVSSGYKTLRVDIPKNGIQSTMNIANDYLIDNVINCIKNNGPIEKFMNNCIISIDSDKNEKIWNLDDIINNWGDRGLRYIRACASKNKIGYNLKWKFKDFPTLK